MECNGHSKKSLVLFPKYLLEITKPVPDWYIRVYIFISNFLIDRLMYSFKHSFINY